MINLFSRYVHSVALPNQTAQTFCTTVLNSWILRFGAPLKILTEEGANFESAICSKFGLLWRIFTKRTTAYHPATKLACERINQSINHVLRKLLNLHNLNYLDTVLRAVLFAYNRTTHSSTGFKPFFLMFGEEARVTCELVSGQPRFEDPPTTASFASNLIRKLELAFDFARENLHAAQKRIKESYDFGVNRRIFKTGDMVYINSQNLQVSICFEIGITLEYAE